MEFIAIMTCTENRRGGERKELKRIEFESPNITAAKARATKQANCLVYLEEVQSWDNAKNVTQGKDLRWQSWSNPPSMFTQSDGKEVAYSRKSATFLGMCDAVGDSITYVACVTIYWEIKD